MLRVVLVLFSGYVCWPPTRRSPGSSRVCLFGGRCYFNPEGFPGPLDTLSLMPCPVLPSLQASCPCPRLCLEEAASSPVAAWVPTALGAGHRRDNQSNLQPHPLSSELRGRVGEPWVEEMSQDGCRGGWKLGCVSACSRKRAPSPCNPLSEAWAPV